MKPPETKYTKIGDSYIAYQVIGDGPMDYLFVNGFLSSVDVQWEYPPVVRFAERMASFSRMIIFDRRGTGASDPVPLDALPTWEDWTEDATAVLDAVGSERTSIFATADSGPMGLLFAATYPQRVSGLMLGNTAARLLIGPDYPIGLTPEQLDAFANLLESGWGTEALAAVASPSQADNPQYKAWAAKFMRSAASPRAAAAQVRYAFGLDARSVLPLIHVPTVIMHAKDFAFIPIECGRYLADHIEGARFIEGPGADINALTDPVAAEIALDLIEEFMTGHVLRADPNRVLATVLFTDIVDSTERAAQLGDVRWKELLDRVDQISEGEIAKFGGSLVKRTGDGHLATFDGPGRAIRCANSLVEAVRPLGIELRAGLHSGEVELRGTDVGGIAVHIGARVSEIAGRSEVLVSATVADLVAGSGFTFEDRGEYELKGITGGRRLFALKSAIR